MKPGNNRPIGLLPHSYKVLADVKRRRSMVRMEEVVSEEQAGFRPGRCTTDQIFPVSSIVEKH